MDCFSPDGCIFGEDWAEKSIMCQCPHRTFRSIRRQAEDRRCMCDIVLMSADRHRHMKKGLSIHVCANANVGICNAGVDL